MDRATSKAPAPGVVPDYVDLIGAPFKFNGRGAGFYDCYGLVMELCRRTGVEIPDLRSPTEQQKIADLLTETEQRWVPCEMGPGAVLTIRVGRLVQHVAFVLTPRTFIHVWPDAHLGVAVERIEEWKHRIVGCYRYVAP